MSVKGLLCVLAASVAAGALLLPFDPDSPDSARLEKLGRPEAVRTLVTEHSPPLVRHWTTGLHDRLPVARP